MCGAAGVVKHRWVRCAGIWQVRWDLVALGLVCCGRKGGVWQRAVCRGQVRYGRLGYARQGWSSCGVAGEELLGLAWQSEAQSGVTWPAR